MTNAPCKDCPNKGCGAYHSECKAYNDWLILHHMEKELNRQQNQVQDNYYQLSTTQKKRRNYSGHY